jgi:hypothetical protein
MRDKFFALKYVSPVNFGQMPLGQMPLGQMPLGQMSLDQMPLDNSVHYHLVETRLKTCSQNARVNTDFYEKCHLAK